MTRHTLFPTGVIALLLCFPVPVIHAQQNSSPALLTFNELVELYENENPSPELSNKLNKLLTTPFVNNSMGTRPARSVKTTTGTNGPYIRVATWNIERGLEFQAVRAALTNDQRFFRRLAPADRSSKFNLPNTLAQAAELSRADIIVLNEVD